MMIKYSILNKNIYINPVNFTYSFNEEDLQGIAPALSTSLPEDKILRIFKPKCYSFGSISRISVIFVVLIASIKI